MSQIHEALKKAAQERVGKQDATLETRLGDITAEIARRPGPPEVSDLPLTARGPATGTTGVNALTRYEDLIKNCAHPEWQLDPLSSFFQGGKPGQNGTERFRTLRSRLYQTASTRILRRLLVTSSIPEEGKTFVASNLAQSIVQQPERRVLLIDADLRAPRLHLAFGAANRPGLTEYLRGEAEECEVIQKGMKENLCLIPAGSQVSKPSELLLSDRMRHLLNLLTPIFDWVIIDSPPALPVHDAIDLAGLTDGVLFVLRAGSTPATVAERAAAEFTNKNLLGIVFNQVKKSDSYGNYEYNYSSEAT